MPINQISYSDADGDSVSVTFDTVRQVAPLASPALLSERYERPGIDGHEVVEAGLRGEEAAWRTTKFLSSAANADTHIEAVYGARGRICTLYDPWGTAWTDVLVEEVSCEKMSVRESGADKLRVVAQLRLRKIA